MMITLSYKKQLCTCAGDEGKYSDKQTNDGKSMMQSKLLDGKYFGLIIIKKAGFVHRKRLMQVGRLSKQCFVFFTLSVDV